MTGTIEIDNLAHAGVKRMTLEATVTRANGTVEHLGTIADSGPQPRFRGTFAKLLKELPW